MDKPKIRVLELYCGIGGIHYALESIPFESEVVGAIDVNTTSNAIYKHNFGLESLMQRNIMSLTTDTIEELKVDMITMSPPCQPFTRLGNKKDCSDPRTQSFLHVLYVLKRLTKKPTYIFLENVQGFEVSDARNLLVDALESCNFNFREFLLSPTSFGIPNSRLRYYLIARQKSHPFCFKGGKLFDESLNNLESCQDCGKHVNFTDMNIKPNLEPYLESLSDDKLQQLLIPDKILSKYIMLLDIVTNESTKSCCFTKGYGRLAEGTGSVLLHNNSINMHDVFKQINAENSINEDKKLQLMQSLKLRYFSPREVSNLMCFPTSFDFPPDITTKQRYKVLGNSVNVFVISKLLCLLLCKNHL